MNNNLNSNSNNVTNRGTGNGISTTQQDIDFLLVDDTFSLLLPPPNGNNQQPHQALGMYQAHGNQTLTNSQIMKNTSHQQVTTAEAFNNSTRGPLHAQMGINNPTFQVPATQESQVQSQAQSQSQQAKQLSWAGNGSLILNRQPQLAFLQQQQQQQQQQQPQQQPQQTQQQQRVFFNNGNVENQNQNPQQNLFQIRPNTPSTSTIPSNGIHLNVQPNFPINQMGGQQIAVNSKVPVINANNYSSYQQQVQVAGNIAPNMSQTMTKSYTKAQSEDMSKKRPRSSTAQPNRQIKPRISTNIGNGKQVNETAMNQSPVPVPGMHSSIPLVAMNPQVNPTTIQSSVPDSTKSDPSTKGKEKAASFQPGKMTKAELEKMAPDERRRYDRNLREQQRSMKISQQIKELRALLTDSHIPFKPNKYSILMSVVDYVKELQNRAVYLDGEHRKLVSTISKTSEIVNSGRAVDSIDCNPSTVGMESELLFVHDIDYKLIFSQCGAALGLAALDGRFIDCNAEFESVSGLSKTQLKQGSLFNLLPPEDMEKFFHLIGEMLKKKEKMSTPPGQSFWSGVILQKHGNFDLTLNVTVTRKPDGMPKFFNCALTTG